MSLFDSNNKAYHDTLESLNFPITIIIFIFCGTYVLMIRVIKNNNRNPRV